MQLPSSVREAILEEIDSYVDTVDEPDAEMVVEYVIEQLELAADEYEMDDLVGALEEHAGLDTNLVDSLTAAFETQSDFVFTGEEVVSTLEELCLITWGGAGVADDEDEDDDEDDD